MKEYEVGGVRAGS